MVTDRAVSFGGPGGPVCGEIKAALYHEAVKPAIYNYIIGLGGRDVELTILSYMINKVAERMKVRLQTPMNFWG